ncbi:hypothetical protein MCAV_00220 [[Mycoplasma] cavipharyngis]|uniref:hypothetical protein n=1 Tax=[Mycoplasma] cavipharyngis TaxID=92757 RepID=UPI0037048D31
MSERSNQKITNQNQLPEFKWKIWYWYFALVSVVLIFFFLAIYMILIRFLNPDLLQTAFYPVYLFLTITINFVLMSLYLWLANKDYLFKKTKVVLSNLTKNPTRYLRNGAYFSILSQTFYFVAIIITYVVAKNAHSIGANNFSLIGNISNVGFLGIFLTFIGISNIVTLVLWSFFQFSLAYHVFRYENEDVIKQFSNQLFNYHHSWDEIASKNKSAFQKTNVNKWSYFVADYQRNNLKEENNETKTTS